MRVKPLVGPPLICVATWGYSPSAPVEPVQSAIRAESL